MIDLFVAFTGVSLDNHWMITGQPPDILESFKVLGSLFVRRRNHFEYLASIQLNILYF